MAVDTSDSAPDDKPIPEREQGRQLDRVNAFSDGVFTIAATLLVLSIDLPSGPFSELAGELPRLIEPTFTYFLSFAVIGRFWLRHHQLFGRLHSSDQRFAVINLVFLSFVALLPAPTELLGRYPGRTAPVVIYAINLVILTLMLQWLYRDAETRGLCDIPRETDGGAHREASYIMLGAFLISIPVAFIVPRLGVYCWVFAALTPTLVGRYHHIRDRRRARN